MGCTWCPSPPLPTSAISMQSALCKHMVSLNSVTWEMSSFSRPSKTLQMLKPGVLEWTFSPPRKRPNNACNNTVSYRQSNCIFQSHLLISIICAAVKSTHGAEWFLICDSRLFLFGCLCCRHTPRISFYITSFLTSNFTFNLKPSHKCSILCLLN